MSNATAKQEALAGLDRRVFVALRTHLHPRPLEVIVSTFSQTGNWGIFWIVLAVLFWLGGASRGLAGVIFLPLALYSTLIANYSVKQSLKRERPISDDPALKPLVGVPSSKSFPSSHAAMSFAGAAVLTLMHPEFWYLFFALAIFMSWTRVYVGVHYPSDILAGTVVGLVMGGLWVAFLNWF